MRSSKIELVYDALPTSKAAAESNTSTPDALAMRTRASGSNVRNNLKKLRDEGRAHILRWTGTNPPAPVWVRGPGEDAPRPPPLSQEEVRRRHRERQQARRQEERVEPIAGLARQLTYESIERARRTPQPWFAALIT